jgi:hypothetical protein
LIVAHFRASLKEHDVKQPDIRYHTTSDESGHEASAGLDSHQARGRAMIEGELKMMTDDEYEALSDEDKARLSALATFRKGEAIAAEAPQDAHARRRVREILEWLRTKGRP